MTRRTSRRRTSLRRNSNRFRSHDVKYYIETVFSDRAPGVDDHRDSWLRKWGKPTTAKLRQIVLGSPVAQYVVSARVVDLSGKTVASYGLAKNSRKRNSRR